MPFEDRSELFRKIPAVDRLMQNPAFEALSAAYPRTLVLKAVKDVLDDLRERIRTDEAFDPASLSLEGVSKRVAERVEKLGASSLRPVVNATGVVIHTNLGRSPLAERVLRKFRALAGGYSNLEYDLETGQRGTRHTHVEAILREITSAEAAMVVNNNAAAVLLCLDTLARGRDVVVSRGQLVEIGGSFRIPDVMRKSGARMVEIGTTNKTHLRDYEEVIGPETALLLKVHTSNFRVVGFTKDVATPDLVALGRKYGIPVVEDLGSGCFVDLSKYGLTGEPTVQEVLSEGVDLVTFSGDKLLGGPQAGIILGRKDLVDGIRKNQLARALRIDKLTLLALEETLRIYRDEGAALREIPTLKMICRPYRSLRSKGERLLKMTGRLDPGNFGAALEKGSSMVGGGALPLLDLPTCLLSLTPGRMSAHLMETWLRAYDPPIIARVEKDRVLLDMRTVHEQELKTVAGALKEMAGDGAGHTTQGAGRPS